MTRCRPLSLAHCLLVTAFLLLTAHCSLLTVGAQSATATLSGTVTDANNALVPGAHVTATNSATGLKREATTSGSGTFTIPLLPPSTYTVLVENQGFTPAEIRNVVLNVGDNVALNIQLKVGSVGATVDVNSDASLINESPGVATVVDRRFVSSLPLNGRSLQTLISLAPGVVTTGATSQTPGQFSVNGQRADSNYFTVDGVSANFGTNNFAGFNPAVSGSVPATNVQGSFSNLASIDALQEFKIQTSTFAPEFGRSPGAQVSLVTRSGEKQYHGSLYEYFRNDIFDANDWFNNQSGIRKQPLRYNNFGGTFGGPVILPRFGEGGSPIWNGRNNTFFFFSYEAQRFTLPQGAVLSVVPSLAARRGAPNQVASQILNAFPLPNGPDIVDAKGNLTGGANFTSAFSEPSKGSATAVRIDHNFGQKVTLFGRYSYAPALSDSRDNRDLSAFNRIGTKTETLTLGSTQVFTTKLVNEARLNLSRQDGTTRQLFDGFGGGVALPETVLFPSTALGGPRRGIITLNGLSLTFGNPFTNVSLGTDELFRQRQISVVDNLTYGRGEHQLKFGVDYRLLLPIIAPAGFIDNSQFANIAGVYNNLTSSTLVLKGIGFTLQFPTYSFYGQDTWRVSRRLTLTYGTRWDINPAPTARGEKQIQTVAQLRDLTAVDFSYLQLAPQGTPQYPTRYNNFGPRVGVAYQVSHRPGRELMLRGGAGLFYDLGQIGFGSIGFPYSFISFLSNQPIPPPAALGIFPAPNFTLGPTNRASVTVAAPGFHLPRIYQWNVTLEQSLGKNQTISGAYVAAVGHGLLRSSTISFLTAPDPNNPLKPFSPNFSGLTILDNGSSSNYQALQVQFTRRLSRGLQATTSYTWSHSIDTGSLDLDRTVPGRVTTPNIDRGNSDFDVRHALTGAVTYNIPVPRWGSLSDAILGHWSFNSIFFARSATPFTVLADQQLATNLFGSNFTRRPNLIQGVPLFIAGSTAPGGKRVNPAAFSFPSNTQAQGTLGRNVLRGFGAWQEDVGLNRQFNLTERASIQFRFEVFNVFNHPNFANPGLPFNPTLAFATKTPGAIAIDSPSLRSIQMLGRGFGGGGNSGGYNPIFQVGGPRSLQFALRLQF